MERTFLTLGSLAGLLGVAFGAFAAHGLRQRLDPEMLAVFETGARYQMYHAFALLAVGLLAAQRRLAPPAANPVGESHPRASRALAAAGWLFALGIVLFSGSLFLLALTGLKWFGAVTPFGGLCFLGGWLMLAVYGWSSSFAPARRL